MQAIWYNRHSHILQIFKEIWKSPEPLTGKLSPKIGDSYWDPDSQLYQSLPVDPLREYTGNWKQICSMRHYFEAVGQSQEAMERIRQRFEQFGFDDNDSLIWYEDEQSDIKEI